MDLIERIRQIVAGEPGCSRSDVLRQLGVRYSTGSDAISRAVASGEIENRSAGHTMHLYLRSRTAPSLAPPTTEEDAHPPTQRSSRDGWSNSPKGPPAVRAHDVPQVTHFDPVAERQAKQREDAERAARARMLDEIEAARAREAAWDALREPPAHVPAIARRERASGEREGMMVVLASDWHIEERVDPEAIDGFNSYDLATSERRVSRFFDGILAVLEIYRGAARVRDLMLSLMGDLITGYLHEELLESNECSPILASHTLKSWLVTGIDLLLAESGLETIHVPCTHGNHGRTTIKPRASTGAMNSFEHLLYLTLADHYRKEPRVRFHVPRSGHVYRQAFDFLLHFHHGDDVKYGGGIGGLAPPLLRRVAAWDKFRRCNYHHIGHFHQALDFGNVSCNGSLIGYNAYALKIGASPEPPAQLAYLLDSQRGKCLQTPIWVGETEKA